VRNTSSSSSSPSSSLPHPPTRAVPLYPRISSSAVPTASSIRPVVPTVRPTSRQLSGVTSSSSADGPLWPAVVRHKGLQCQQCIADCQFDPASSANSQTEQSSVERRDVFQQCRRSAWASRCAPQRLAVPAVQCRLPVRSDQQNQLPVRCGQQCRQSARGSLNGVTRRQPAVPTVRLVGQPVCATKLGGKLLQCQQCIVSALLTQAEYPLPV